MGRPASRQTLGSGRRRYLSRTSAAVVALILHGALVYLLASQLGVLRLPTPPNVEPLLVTLMFQPRSLPAAPQLTAMQPEMARLHSHLPDTPPDFRIEVPTEALPPQNSLPELGNGAPSTDGPPTAGSEGGASVFVVRHVEPVYSSASAQAHEQGIVAVRVLVDEQGRPKHVELLRSSGFPRLDASALRSVRRYRFASMMRGSQPVPIWTTVHVEFNLLPMPIPVTVVDFDERVAEQIASATRTNGGRPLAAPSTQATLRGLVEQLLAAVSSERAEEIQQPASIPRVPIEQLAVWGELQSVQFVGFASRGFASDIPETGTVTGTLIPGRNISRWEIYEVKQAGGTSYWLAAVAPGGTPTRLQITVASDPRILNASGAGPQSTMPATRR
jgi:periplasmic protein TonB